MKTSIARDGWTNAAVKEFALTRQPYLTIDKGARWNGPKPPINKADIRYEEIVSVSVKYPQPYKDATITDEFLLAAVREFRRNLEHAVYLEQEIGQYGSLYRLSPIVRDQSAEDDSYERSHGMSSILLYYVELFKRLVEKDPQVAKQECLAWLDDEETVFSLLWIWIAGEPRIFSGKEAGEMLMRLSMKSFWEHRHQRDLLLVLEKRWNDFPKVTRARLERRLLQGPPSWESEKKKEYIYRRSLTILSLLHWLEEHNCRFSFDLIEKSKKLRKQAPEWQPKFAATAADSLEGRGGWIKKETEYSALLTEPPENILQKAKDLGGRDFDRLMEHDPFAGLSMDRPERALAALVSNAGRNDYPEWAWRTFLYAEARKKDDTDFSVQIGSNILNMSDDVIGSIISPVSEWLLNVSKGLLTTRRDQFWKIWERLIAVIKLKPESAPSNIIRQKKDLDFAAEGFNAPIGKLAQALLKDPAIDKSGKKKSLPSFWKKHVNELLHLHGDLHRHALVMFVHHLGWFYTRDPRWTQMNLISFLDSGADDQMAFWSGLFWNPRLTPELFKILKPYVICLTSDKSIEKQGYLHALCGIILSAWWNKTPKTGERHITNTEMRDVLLQVDNDFRVQILWQTKNLLTKRKADKTNLSTFLMEVWPKHKKAKSSQVSTALCDLAFTDSDTFGCLADIILPLVSEIDNQGGFLYKLDDSKIIDLFPEKVLALLYAILPDDISAWPYGTGETIKRLGEVTPALLKDKRLAELRKRLSL